ncbi:type II secretion system protein [Massilia sp. NR 4-1]|uniref:type II secretion system protein n=1 Tax=Massilia sp. NR 4-1 TaxID=1678028 RepID=UPI00067BA027|nr:type II secretion system protein [Massilia sp. NR 4-1]AKU21360.1 hypothetical protein ACZ75_07570 [Massilia sp. NR 4-1]
MKARRADGQAVAAAQRGFSLFELGVVLAVIAILSAVFLQRVLFYQDEAERVAVAQVLAQLRATLQARSAEWRYKGRERELPAFTLQNPMLWLARPPPNYAGELSEVRSDRLLKGSWYFDPAEKVLVYMPRQGGLFGSGSAAPLRFRIVLQGSAVGKEAAPAGVVGGIDGLSLEQVLDN